MRTRVWIQSSWLGWHLEFLSESLERLKVFNDQIIVFGSKNLILKMHHIIKINMDLKDYNKNFKYQVTKSF